METRKEKDDHTPYWKKRGNKHFKKIFRKRDSVGVVFAEWLVIGVDGKVSSPNEPARAGGSKSR